MIIILTTAKWVTFHECVVEADDDDVPSEDELAKDSNAE